MEAQIDRRWHDATLDTEELLREHYNVGPDGDEEWAERFAKWMESTPDEHRYRNYFTVGAEFMESQGFECLARDNTYNGENNLSRDYVWEVWAPEGAHVSDWIYATEDDGVVVVIYMHRGGDPRGNYSPARFYVPDFHTEYTIPVDLTAEVWPVEVRDPEGFEVDPMDHWSVVERYTNGYTSAPWFTFVDECRVFAFPGGEENTLCAVTPDGYRVKVRAGAHVAY